MILLVILIAFILRFIQLNQSLWLDEAIYVLAIKQQSLWDIISRFLIGDFHPPLYISILWIWDHLFGFSEISSRIPSVIFGVAAVYLTFIFGKEIISKKVGLLSALLLAISPLYVYYSQEARMYSMSAFLAVLSFLFFWRLINNQKWGAIGFTISTILILYTDYPLALIIPTQILYILIFERKVINKITWPIIISSVAFIPWLFIFQKQLISGQAVAASLPNWSKVVGGSSLKELALIPVKIIFGRISFDNKYLYAVLTGVAGILYLGVLVNSIRKIDKRTWLLIFWTVIPVLLAFIISFFIPILSYFRMIYILPGIYLLLAKGLDNLPKKIFIPTFFGLILISIISLGIYYTNPKFQREDWKNAVSNVEQKSGQNGMILLESNNTFSPFQYYDNHLTKSEGGLKKVPAESSQDLININDLKKNNIYLFEYLVDINDPQRFLQKSLENNGYKNIETVNYNGVGFVYHYKLQ